MTNQYIRFIIVSEERTGSTLLQMLLNSHERIICRGEILNPSDEIRRASVPLHMPLLGADEDALQYLDSNLYGQVAEAVGAVGFRLMYSHALTGRWTHVVRDLASDPEVRVVHLTREDLLARYLSHRLAETNGHWISMADAPADPDDTIRIDVEDCVRSLTESEVNRDRIDQMFSEHSKYDLTYEKLTGDLDFESRKVLEFLDVEYQQLHSPTKRQRKRSKREVIENFEELRQILTRGNARWQRFFEAD